MVEGGGEALRRARDGGRVGSVCLLSLNEASFISTLKC